MTPKAFVPPDQAEITGGRQYKFPGPELLAWDKLKDSGLDYVQTDHPGWAHIAVIITNSPLIPIQTIQKTDPDNPFARLTNEEISTLILHSAPFRLPERYFFYICTPHFSAPW